MGVCPVIPAVFTDASVHVRVPYTLTANADVVDPRLDVHARFSPRGESLANSVTVTKPGTMCTAAGAHVTSEAVINVLRQREVMRVGKAECKHVAAAAAAQKKIE